MLNDRQNEFEGRGNSGRKCKYVSNKVVAENREEVGEQEERREQREVEIEDECGETYNYYKYKCKYIINKVQVKRKRQAMDKWMKCNQEKVYIMTKHLEIKSMDNQRIDVVLCYYSSLYVQCQFCFILSVNYTKPNLISMPTG